MSKAVTAAPYVFVVDTVQRLSPAILAAMRDHPLTPIRGVAIYIPMLDAAYRDSIHAAGLAIIPVTFGNRPGFTPTSADGKTKGQSDVVKLQSVQCPAGVTVYSDFEETAIGATSQQGADELNARGQVQKAAGYDPGVYVGAQQPMNGVQLAALIQNRYWKGLSRLTLGGGNPAGFVIEPLVGWSMEQLYKTTTLVGVGVDVSVIHYDWLGRLPTWWAP